MAVSNNVDSNVQNQIIEEQIRQQQVQQQNAIAPTENNDNSQIASTETQTTPITDAGANAKIGELNAQSDVRKADLNQQADVLIVAANSSNTSPANELPIINLPNLSGTDGVALATSKTIKSIDIPSRNETAYKEIIDLENQRSFGIPRITNNQVYASMSSNAVVQNAVFGDNFDSPANALAKSFMARDNDTQFAAETFKELGAKGLVAALSEGDESIQDYTTKSIGKDEFVSKHEVFRNLLDGMVKENKFGEGDMYLLAKTALDINTAQRPTADEYLKNETKNEGFVGLNNATKSSITKLDEFFTDPNRPQLKAMWEKGLSLAIGDVTATNLTKYASVGEINKERKTLDAVLLTKSTNDRRVISAAADLIVTGKSDGGFSTINIDKALQTTVPSPAGATDNLLAVIIGTAEGTRNLDGSVTKDWTYNNDSGLDNVGTFSYTGGGKTPAEADIYQWKQIKTVIPEYTKTMNEIGRQPDALSFMTFVDMYNQGIPDLTLGKGGFLDQLKEMGKKETPFTSENVYKARMRSWVDPNTGKVAGFGKWQENGYSSKEEMFLHDQTRRANALLDGLKKADFGSAPSIVEPPVSAINQVLGDYNSIVPPVVTPQPTSDTTNNSALNKNGEPINPTSNAADMFNSDGKIIRKPVSVEELQQLLPKGTELARYIPAPIVNQYGYSPEDKNGQLCMPSSLLVMYGASHNGNLPIDVNDKNKVMDFAYKTVFIGNQSDGSLVGNMSRYDVNANFKPNANLTDITAALDQGHVVPVGVQGFPSTLALTQTSNGHPERVGGAGTIIEGRGAGYSHWVTVVGYTGSKNNPTGFIINDSDTGAQLYMKSQDFSKASIRNNDTYAVFYK
jgi:hypothetical protein